MNPVWLSLAIAGVATVCVALAAVPLAYALARAKFAGKSILETALMLPLILPPTVVGYFILVALGARGWPGRWLFAAFDYSIVFRFEGAVLAAAIVSFPLLYLPVKAAFAAVERESQDVAALFGASRWQVFWHVSLPAARGGLLSGLVLAFARALGEFGATVMVFGWQPGRLTMPVAIYATYEQGDLRRAAPLALLMTLICFGLLAVYNRLAARGER